MSIIFLDRSLVVGVKEKEKVMRSVLLWVLLLLLLCFCITSHHITSHHIIPSHTTHHIIMFVIGV